MAIRYKGHLGMGHVYMDVKEALLEPVKALLKKVYDCIKRYLESNHKLLYN